jgi:NAD(P)-dependent dehydrogenase (short-subunit alcohol dehydrogenase family)
VACNGDVTAKDFGERVVKTAVDAFGGCHIVVNNAGYTWDSVIQKMSDEQWYAIIDVHLTAPFRILRAFFDYLKPAVEAERREGQRIVRKVVNISSTSGVNGNAGQVNYSAGKAGMMGMTKTLAKEWGRYDVTVNAVAFGYIQTRLTKPLQEGDWRQDRRPGPHGEDRRAGGPHRRAEPDDSAGPRRHARGGGRLGLPVLQPRQRLCQRPDAGGQRRIHDHPARCADWPVRPVPTTGTWPAPSAASPRPCC